MVFHSLRPCTIASLRSSDITQGRKDARDAQQRELSENQRILTDNRNKTPEKCFFRRNLHTSQILLCDPLLSCPRLSQSSISRESDDNTLIGG